MKTILITGASGFIGKALCQELSSNNKVIGIDHKDSPHDTENILWEKLDLTDANSTDTICKRYRPDVVIHSAGIAHQKIGKINYSAYKRVNSEATEILAKAASDANSSVQFIFFSSVSVYGENNLILPVTEDAEYQPSSDYALSKVDAEKRLRALSDKGLLHYLIILRLVLVYDFEWSFNLDRRVFAPMKMVYIKFGTGMQKISALARPNLIEFIQFLLLKSSSMTPGVAIMNVCDPEPYTFNKIIQVFKNSGIRPYRPLISIPLSLVWLLTRMIGFFFSKRKKWLYSCHEKLALDLIFDNKKMLGTGFQPHYSLESIFLKHSNSSENI